VGVALGAAGERVVARALVRAGWRKLGARLATQDAELDLLMLDGETLVVVEVKTGRCPFARAEFETRALWRPGHRFGRADLARLRRAADRIGQRLGRQARVDLVELLLFPSGATQFHHVDIVTPLLPPEPGRFGRVLGP